MRYSLNWSREIGFTKDAAIKLKLADAKSARIALNEDEKSDENLYVIIDYETEEAGFKINKAGEYYYINTKALFDGLEMDYLKESYVYDITTTTIDDQQVYKFKRSPSKKSAKNNLPINGGS
jgi:hypothetical protein